MDTVETASCEVQETVSLQIAPQSYKVAEAEAAKETLTILCSDAKLMRGFIARAIERSVGQLLVSIPRLEQEIQEFETKYGMSSAEFLRRYREDKIQETDETIDWYSNCRMYEHLCHKLQLLREASFNV